MSAMKKSVLISAITLFLVPMIVTGYGRIGNVQIERVNGASKITKIVSGKASKYTTVVTPATKITQLEEGLSDVRYDGDYRFDKYLRRGGTSSDAEVINFLTDNLFPSATRLKFGRNVFGCSTISVKNMKGYTLFGRNFDWENCSAMVVRAKPKNGYASISTVNMDFIRAGGSIKLTQMPSEIQTIAALYAPLDGMNERGFCVSVNMIQDSDTIEQNTKKPDITTTTAVRLLLDKAANVKEALALLAKYDLHASMGMMVHFALSDVGGRSVVVEYVDNKMVVTDTPVVTNFYIAKGKKNGIGTAQSHTRYDILMKQLKKTPTMSMEGVRDALDSVSKHNFGEYESTEWSIVFNQKSKEVHYYHRENYAKCYTFTIK